MKLTVQLCVCMYRVVQVPYHPCGSSELKYTFQVIHYVLLQIEGHDDDVNLLTAHHRFCTVVEMMACARYLLLLCIPGYLQVGGRVVLCDAAFFTQRIQSVKIADFYKDLYMRVHMQTCVCKLKSVSDLFWPLCIVLK